MKGEISDPSQNYTGALTLSNYRESVKVPDALMIWIKEITGSKEKGSLKSADPCGYCPWHKKMQLKPPSNYDEGTIDSSSNLAQLFTRYQ